MYLFSGIFILFLAIWVFINLFRRKKNIRKVSCMSMDEKYCRLEQLIEPFGYSYNSCQDVFSTTLDAWQKEFGYIDLFDKVAPRINMVFDCEPIYFYYDNRTWLIELWKGQYGINIGGEIGVYNVDYIVPRRNLKKTLFNVVSECEMLPLSLNLLQGQNSIARLSARHWWLTAFKMGNFCKPSKLAMNISITFPDMDMLSAFVGALMEVGYSKNDICVCGLQVYFSFDKPYTRSPGCALFRAISLLEDRFFCWLFRFVSRPFCLTVDQLLYLYYFLPFAFRRMLRLKRFKKHRRRRERY